MLPREKPEVRYIQTVSKSIDTQSSDFGLSVMLSDKSDDTLRRATVPVEIIKPFVRQCALIEWSVYDNKRTA
jgi:hypothetical protein